MGTEWKLSWADQIAYIFYEEESDSLQVHLFDGLRNELGDYVLVHAGFAIQKIDEDAARETLDLLNEIARNLDQEPDRVRKSPA